MENDVVNTGIAASNLASKVASHIDPWQLFLQADIIGKSVIVILILASIFCWSIIFAKFITVARAKKQARDFEDKFWSGGNLNDLYDGVSNRPQGALSRVFLSGMTEYNKASNAPEDGLDVALTRQRIDRSMDTSLVQEMEKLEGGMSFLATVGSTAPFIGLLGTVWGIMNSFNSIALSKQTSLDVVAPGISEALFATALGLLAAIPATIFYNKISTDLTKIAGRMEGFIGEFGNYIARKMYER